MCFRFRIRLACSLGGMIVASQLVPHGTSDSTSLQAIPPTALLPLIRTSSMVAWPLRKCDERQLPQR